MVKENEYTFNRHNVDQLLSELAHPGWDIIAHLLSFFGHYGVPVFVMLSAYGLVKKYESHPTTQSAAAFIRTHFVKLFMMMIVGYTAFVMVDYMTPHPRHYEFWNVVGQLGMFSNLYADPDHAIWPGPYWYFGLMLQLYIVYRLMLFPGKGSVAGRLTQRGAMLMAIAIAVVLMLWQMLLDPMGDALNRFRYNCLGHLPLFIAVIYATRHEQIITQRHITRTAYALTAVIGLLLIFLMSPSFLAWQMVPFVVCVTMFAIVQVLPQTLMKPLAWVGDISAAMFVCHPITRKVIIPIAHQGDIFAALILYLAATIILAIIFKRIMAIINTH